MYSADFQRQVLKLLYTNLVFFNNFGSLLATEYFENQHLRILFFLINKYINKYEKEPTNNDLQLLVDEYCNSKGYASETVDLLHKEFEYVNNTAIASEQFVIDNVVKFVRRQRFKSAILQAAEMISKNEDQFEVVLKSIDEAVAIGAGVDTGKTFQDLLTFLPEYRKLYSKDILLRTGFPSFDNAVLGGLAPGELHIITAPPGRGKSTLGVNIGAMALIQAAPVFHFTLELKALDVLAKYACRLSGLTYAELMSVTDEEYKLRMAKFQQFKPNLYVKYYSPNTINAHTIRSFISKKRSELGVKPGLIIVDYDDLILPVGTIKGSLYEDSGTIHTDLISLADYFQSPVLTFSQPKVYAWNKEEGVAITQDELASSSKKGHSAYSISSLNRDRKNRETGYLFVDKVRRGKDQITIPLAMDLDRCYIMEDTSKYVSQVE